MRKFAHFFGRQGQPGPIGRIFFDFLHGVPGTAWYERQKNDSNCSQHLQTFRNRGAAAAPSEILLSTALCAAPNPLLLTVVRPLGVVRANFLASCHPVPGTTSSRVKKIF